MKSIHGQVHQDAKGEKHTSWISFSHVLFKKEEEEEEEEEERKG